MVRRTTQAGELLRDRRVAHGLSQHDLALRAGTRQSTISRIETGRETPTVDRLDQLLLALGERLELDAHTLDRGRSLDDLRSDRAKSMAERLEDGFALVTLAPELAGDSTGTQRLDPARIFDTLDRHGVDYLTIGGFAVIAHGYVRATAAIDLVARQDADNLARLAAAFAELGARRRRVGAHLLDVDPTDPGILANGAGFALDTDAGPVVYMNDVPGAADYDQMRRRAVDARAAGVAVRVISLAELIRMKRASARPQDLLDIANLTGEEIV